MAVKRKPKPEAPTDLVVYDDVEQGSPEWFDLRLGMPTASNFSIIMAHGKDGGPSVERRRLMYQLAGEILTGIPAEQFVSEAMKRGKEMEPRAINDYAAKTFDKVQRIGFAKRVIARHGTREVVAGCSPDALVGKNALLEIKTMAPHLMIERFENGASGFPPEHRAQCHGSLWLLDREQCDLKLFYRGMPFSPVFTIYRDDVYIKEISNAVQIFEHELCRLVERLRARGGK